MLVSSREGLGAFRVLASASVWCTKPLKAVPRCGYEVSADGAGWGLGRVGICGDAIGYVAVGIATHPLHLYAIIYLLQ